MCSARTAWLWKKFMSSYRADLQSAFLVALYPHEDVGLLKQVAFSDPTWVTAAAGLQVE